MTVVRTPSPYYNGTRFGLSFTAGEASVDNLDDATRARVEANGWTVLDGDSPEPRALEGEPILAAVGTVDVNGIAKDGTTVPAHPQGVPVPEVTDGDVTRQPEAQLPPVSPATLSPAKAVKVDGAPVSVVTAEAYEGTVVTADSTPEAPAPKAPAKKAAARKPKAS